MDQVYEAMALVHYLSGAHEKPNVLGLRGFSREVGDNIAFGMYLIKYSF
ncbi:MAG TPA: hypothetical protein VIM16_21410 [Mucilaginibacter sp.]